MCESSQSTILMPCPYYDYKVGFIGAGKMAQAFASGFISAGVLEPGDIYVSAPTSRNLSHFKNELGVRVSHDNADVARNSSVIFLAVKPHFVHDVVKQIKHDIKPEQVVVSVIAGLTVESLEDHFCKGTQVIRAMPNIAIQVRAGVTAFVCGKTVTEEAVKAFVKLTENLGICKEVPESIMDSVTGMAGSGPAFVFLMMQAMADGGVKMGIPRHLASEFAVQTFLGAAKLVQSQDSKHPAILMEEVASPGGTTIHGLHQMEKDGVRAAVINAVEAATKQAKVLCSK